MTQARSFLLIDPDTAWQNRVRAHFERGTEFRLVGQASSARDASALVREKDPDILVTELSLQPGDGIALIGEMKRRNPSLPSIICSSQEEAVHAERAIRAGARGYVMKSGGMESLEEALDTVARGDIHAGHMLQQRLLRRLAHDTPPADESKPVEKLSHRERQVFMALGEGKSTQEITQSLHINAKTVDTYRRRIRAKLGVNSAAELIFRATEWVLSLRR